MLNSSEHEIFSANKYENANKSSTMINPQWFEQPTEQISMVPKMLEVRLYVWTLDIKWPKTLKYLQVTSV